MGTAMNNKPPLLILLFTDCKQPARGLAHHHSQSQIAASLSSFTASSLKS